MKQWLEEVKYCRDLCQKGAQNALHRCAEHVLKGHYFPCYFPIHGFQTGGTESCTEKIHKLLYSYRLFSPQYSEIFLTVFFITKSVINHHRLNIVFENISWFKSAPALWSCSIMSVLRDNPPVIRCVKLHYPFGIVSLEIIMYRAGQLGKSLPAFNIGHIFWEEKRHQKNFNNACSINKMQTRIRFCSME